MRLFNRKVRLATTQEAFEAQAKTFLAKYDLAVDETNLALFATFIQHGGQDSDSFDPHQMARTIRRQHTNRCAFYMLHPDKLPKKEAASEEAPAVSEEAAE